MLELIDQSAPAAQAASQTAWVPIVASLVAFLGGVALWLAGRHVLRPGFVFIGTFTGAVVGVLGGSAIQTDVDPLIFGVFGLITGGILGWLLFRTAVALSMGLILAIALTVITASTVAFQSPAPKSEPGSAEVDQANELSQSEQFSELLNDLWDNIPPATLEPPPPEPESILDRAEDAANDLDLLARTSEFARGLAGDIEPVWTQTPPAARWLLLGSAVVGFGLGLVVGLAAPKRAAGAVTAFMGPAIWIPSAAWLLIELDVGAERMMPSRSVHWLGVWAAAVIIGLAAQWTRKKPIADKA